MEPVTEVELDLVAAQGASPHTAGHAVPGSSHRRAEVVMVGEALKR